MSDRILAEMQARADLHESRNRDYGYVTNCFVKGREGDALFSDNGKAVVATLDGYAIIPLEVYREMKSREEGIYKGQNDE